MAVESFCLSFMPYEWVAAEKKGGQHSPEILIIFFYEVILTFTAA